MKKSILLIFVLFLIVVNAKAQDTLQLKNGAVYITEIKIVGSEEVNYKLFNDPTGPTFILNKKNIYRIILHSGTELNFSGSNNFQSKTFIDKRKPFENKKNALKWEMLSLISNDLCFGYERYIGNKQSIELKVASIGIGNSDIEDFHNAKGYFVKLGYKFIQPFNGNKNTLLGSYVKPEISYAEFKTDSYTFISKYAMINFGVETPLFGSLLLDIYGGIGVARNEYPRLINNTYNNFFYNYQRSYFYSNASLESYDKYTSCVSGGFVLSFCF